VGPRAADGLCAEGESGRQRSADQQYSRVLIAGRDANLQPLLQWVAEYHTRDGPMSLRAHEAVFASWAGPKVQCVRVPELSPPDPDVLAWLR
jgi:hypothetical protein